MDDTTKGPPRITRIVQTCVACPSQWEGDLSDGRQFYARYRGGRGYFAAADTVDNAIAPTGEVLASWMGDDPLDGWMDTATMLAFVRRQAGITLETTS